MIFPIENLHFADIFNLKPADKYSLGKGSVILYRKGVPNLLAKKKESKLLHVDSVFRSLARDRFFP